MSDALSSITNAIMHPLTIDKKIAISAVAAGLFIVTSLPAVYEQTSRLTPTIDGTCPNPVGKLLHTAIWFALMYGFLKIGKSPVYATIMDYFLCLYLT